MNRYTRNRDIVNQECINENEVVIIGVGAIGSALAEQLAKLGVMNFILIDHDEVDEVNLSVQGFYEDEVGLAKVDAVASKLRAINSQVHVTTCKAVWNTANSNSMIPQNSVIFSTVDSIDVRRQIFNHEIVYRRQPVMFDARMTSETFEAYCVDSSVREHVEAYRNSLFDSEEAFPAPCTARSTIYCASIAAGFLTSMFKNWSIRRERGFYNNRIGMDIRTFDVTENDMFTFPVRPILSDEAVEAVSDGILSAVQ